MGSVMAGVCCFLVVVASFGHCVLVVRCTVCVRVCCLPECVLLPVSGWLGKGSVCSRGTVRRLLVCLLRWLRVLGALCWHWM